MPHRGHRGLSRLRVTYRRHTGLGHFRSFCNTIRNDRPRYARRGAECRHRREQRRPSCRVEPGRERCFARLPLGGTASCTTWAPLAAGPPKRPKSMSEGRWSDAVITADGRSYPFLWSDGVMYDLDAGGQSGPPCCSDQVHLNNVGHVIWNGPTTDGFMHAFLWRDGVVTDLGTLGGTLTIAHDINDRDQIVGSSSPVGGAKQHAFLWDEGTMYDIAWFGGGAPTTALSINNRGQVVGTGFTPRILRHPFVWRRGELRALNPDFQADRDRRASAMNEHGLVAGGGGFGLSARVWEDGVLSEPGSLGGRSSGAAAVNARGDVVGLSWLDSSRMHAVLWRRTVPGGADVTPELITKRSTSPPPVGLQASRS